MKWAPTQPQWKPVPWALVICGPGYLRIVTEEGQVHEAKGNEQVAKVWARMSGYAIYSRSPWRAIAASAGDAKMWTIWTWAATRVTSLQRKTANGSITVWPLSGLLDGCDDVDAAWIVSEWVEWLRRNGVQPGAPSTCGMRLWTNTLERTLTVRAPREVDPRRALFGGRQQAPLLGRFVDCEQQDITTAYPHSLAMTPVAVAWHERSRLDLDGDDDGLAEVVVSIPEGAGDGWAALPVRRGDGSCDWPMCETVEGLWTFDDLRVAVDAGAMVERVDGVWVARSTADVWQRWWARVVEGRELSNPLVKLTCNRLWGAFAQRLERGKFIPRDDYASVVDPQPVHDTSKELPLSMATQMFVAAFCASRVRSRLWWEAIRPDKAIYVDTDSAITEKGEHIEPNSGRPGTWRPQRIMNVLDIVGPQGIRWATDSHGKTKWHYAVSGVAPHNAEKMFDRMATTKGRIQRGRIHYERGGEGSETQDCGVAGRQQVAF
jgi:hypothetical protein